MKFPCGVARLFVTVVALCIVAAPVRLSAQETKVLFLIAKHPYVPVLLVTNGAMHDFAFEDFEQEFLALLAKKYKGLQIDVIHSVRDGSRSR